MDILISLGIFLCGIAVCMVGGFSLNLALFLGVVCFFIAGMHRGFTAKEVFSMALGGARTSLVVLRILLLIGCLTALWRSSGTVAFFVHTGLTLVTPRLFILVAFLLPALFCLAFGSSFGVAGTAGVVLMVMARSGGANLAITAGAIFCGAFWGERLSPASSAAILTATVSGVEQNALQRRLWKRTFLPTAVTLLILGALSYLFPIQNVDAQILQALEEGFRLTWPTILPAAVLLLLPSFHFTAARSILVSCLLAAVIAVAVQGMSPLQVLHDCLFGHAASHPMLSSILSGGGIFSMVNSCVLVMLSCMFSGIFNGTGMLDPVKRYLSQLSHKLGLFPTMILVSFASAGMLCNQSVAIVVTEQMMEDSYRDQGRDNMELAADVADSALPLAALVPWCIACSVPLATIGAGFSALPFAVFLYIMPLCTWLCKRLSKNGTY